MANDIENVIFRAASFLGFNTIISNIFFNIAIRVTPCKLRGRSLKD